MAQVKSTQGLVFLAYPARHVGKKKETWMTALLTSLLVVLGYRHKFFDTAPFRKESKIPLSVSL